MSMIIYANRVITGLDDLHDAWVAVDAGRIVDVGVGNPPSGQIEQVEGWLVPGFVDLHVHGGGGGAFSDGGVEAAARFHLRHGTTTLLASLVSERIDDLVAQVAALRPSVESGLLAGIHLEGPFLAHGRHGAHDPRVLVAPTDTAVRTLVESGAGTIRMVTLAPELPDAQAAIATLAARGIRVALGHSDADATVTHYGINAGATIVTHLFNGMRPMHHREPGLAEVALLDSRVTCEFILDGHHLSDETVEIALRMLGDRWIAVTDAMAAAGLADGRYTLGSLAVEAKDGVVRVIESGALAGSTLTMDRAFDAIVHRHHRSPIDAVRATASRPAALIGRHDIGTIRPGARADLVVLHDGRASRVMREGAWID